MGPPTPSLNCWWLETFCLVWRVSFSIVPDEWTCAGYTFMSNVHSNGLGKSQQDNATPHTSSVASEWLQEHSSGFRHFQWLHKSLNMDNIEQILYTLQRYVQTRSPPHRTHIDLWTALQDSWRELIPRYLHTLVESMPRCVASLLHARDATILRRHYTILCWCVSFSGTWVYFLC